MVRQGEEPLLGAASSGLNAWSLAGLSVVLHLEPGNSQHPRTVGDIQKEGDLPVEVPMFSCPSPFLDLRSVVWPGDKSMS